ncbi:MAG: ABC transporter ATP-binding protein [Leucobacter sp.]|uniref:Organosulfonate ABC transporter ATP-binding protein n=1 Tax=Agrococcus casei LMG 22410 TaxID=1255656 RepID=A0A1R4GBD3_9MICO|nr:ABC transporter ATP-binding protein [Agrococcus casei]SJM65466.1 Organosulfonate ABC transporter ATP-binding protein [Agrococcus casei LMG 22410]
MPNITVRGAEVKFPGTKKHSEPVLALSDVNLSIPDQQFVCLLGPSGCGKSTLLNLIAGFLEPTDGEVLVDDEPVAGPGPERGVVFQSANVFPWLTCAQNVAFGPKLRGKSKAEVAEQVDHYLERVGLLPFKDRLPMELSGGMRQRLSLARVLINDPPILLMDEPFGALDAQTRIIMQELLLELWERDRKTVIFVTHDIDEALLLADRVYVMSTRPGRILDHVDVPLARPRNYQVSNDKAFRDLRQSLFEQLHDDAAHSANVA